jgi:membrane protein implicated in regulation of membrane protease activity
VGVGIFLIIIGAILAFAVRRDTSAVDLQIVGLILMVAGGALVYLTRSARSRVRQVTAVEDNTDPEKPVHRVHETVVDQDPNSDY